MIERCADHGEVVVTAETPLRNLSPGDLHTGSLLKDIPIGQVAPSVTLIPLHTVKSMLLQAEGELRKASPHPLDCTVVGFHVERISSMKMVLARRQPAQRRIEDENLAETAAQEVALHTQMVKRLRPLATAARKHKLDAERIKEALDKEPDSGKACRTLGQMMRSSQPIRVDGLDVVPSGTEPLSTLEIAAKDPYRVVLHVTKIDYENAVATCTLAGGENLHPLFSPGDLERRKLLLKGNRADISICGHCASLGIPVEATASLTMVIHGKNLEYRGTLREIHNIPALQQEIRAASDDLFRNFVSA